MRAKQTIGVDDKPAMVRMPQKKLEKLGCDVTGAPGTEKALDLV